MQILRDWEILGQTLELAFQEQKAGALCYDLPQCWACCLKWRRRPLIWQMSQMELRCITYLLFCLINHPVMLYVTVLTQRSLVTELCPHPASMECHQAPLWTVAAVFPEKLSVPGCVQTSRVSPSTPKGRGRALGQLQR